MNIFQNPNSQPQHNIFPNSSNSANLFQPQTNNNNPSFFNTNQNANMMNNNMNNLNSNLNQGNPQYNFLGNAGNNMIPNQNNYSSMQGGNNLSSSTPFSLNQNLNFQNGMVFFYKIMWNLLCFYYFDLF